MIKKIRDTNGGGEFYSVRYTGRAVMIRADETITGHNEDDMVEWSKISLI
jgi:hypothetical protein